MTAKSKHRPNGPIQPPAKDESTKLESVLAAHLQRLYRDQGILVVQEGRRVFYYCTSCSKWAFTDASLADHLQGKRHKKTMEVSPPSALPVCSPLKLLPSNNKNPPSASQHHPYTLTGGASSNPHKACSAGEKRKRKVLKTPQCKEASEGASKRGHTSAGESAFSQGLRFKGESMTRSRTRTSALDIGLPPWKVKGGADSASLPPLAQPSKPPMASTKGKGVGVLPPRKRMRFVAETAGQGRGHSVPITGTTPAKHPHPSVHSLAGQDTDSASSGGGPAPVCHRDAKTALCSAGSCTKGSECLALQLSASPAPSPSPSAHAEIGLKVLEYSPDLGRGSTLCCCDGAVRGCTCEGHKGGEGGDGERREKGVRGSGQRGRTCEVATGVNGCGKVDDEGKGKEEKGKCGKSGKGGRRRGGKGGDTERLCFICGLEMKSGERVACPWNMGTNQAACSSRNDHGKFHIFHLDCLWDWTVFSTASMDLNGRLNLQPSETNQWTDPTAEPPLSPRSPLPLSLSRGGSGMSTDTSDAEGEGTKGLVHLGASRGGGGGESEDEGLDVSCGTKNGELEGEVVGGEGSGVLLEVFCPECQGTGNRGPRGDLEHPRYRLSQVYDWILTVLLSRKPSPNNDSSLEQHSDSGRALVKACPRMLFTDPVLQEAIEAASIRVKTVGSEELGL